MYLSLFLLSLQNTGQMWFLIFEAIFDNFFESVSTKLFVKGISKVLAVACGQSEIQIQLIGLVKPIHDVGQISFLWKLQSFQNQNIFTI